MQNLTVRTRLGVVVAVLAAALLLVSGIAAYNLKQTNGRFESTYNDRVVPLDQLKLISDMYAVNIVDTAHKTRDGAVSWQDAGNNITAARKQIRSNWEAYIATYLTPEEKKLADAASAAMKTADAAVDRLSVLVSQQNRDGLTAFAAREMYPAIDPVTDAVSKLVDLQLRVAKEEFTDSMTAYHDSLVIFAVLVGAALVAGLVLAAAIIRQLVNELGGEPAEVAALAHAIAQGRLNNSVRVRPGDDSSVLASFARMQEQMRTVIGEIIASTHQMSAAANQLAASSTQLSAGTESQSGATANMAAAVEELTVSINHVSDSARSGDELARNSNQLSQAGGTVINEAASGMLSIVSRVQETANEITRLGNESETISNVVQVIKEVADQTNLLALNAAIEAARAGEQGRGFAVVADEVRKLAERTTNATGEIGELIAAIQHSAKSAVGSMHEVVSTVEAGSTHASNAGRSIDEITGMSEKVMCVVQEISTALSEQSVACTEIAQNVERVAQMAEENGAATSEVAQSARLLEGLSQRLDQSVAVFQL